MQFVKDCNDLHRSSRSRSASGSAPLNQISRQCCSLTLSDQPTAFLRCGLF